MRDEAKDIDDEIQREREAEQLHRALQGQGREDDEDLKPAERERAEAVDRATRDVVETLDHLDGRPRAEAERPRDA